jgi:hypothetical protein
VQEFNKQKNGCPSPSVIYLKEQMKKHIICEGMSEQRLGKMQLCTVDPQCFTTKV